MARIPTLETERLLLRPVEESDFAAVHRILGDSDVMYAWEHGFTAEDLTAIAADIVFPKGLMALKNEGFENPEAVLVYAINSEKDSVLFYTEMQNHTLDSHASDVFGEITRQERGHLFRLQRRLDQISQ